MRRRGSKAKNFLPSFLSVAESKTTPGGAQGTWRGFDDSAVFSLEHFCGVAFYSDSLNAVLLMDPTTPGEIINASSPFFWAAGDGINVNMTLPITEFNL